MLRSELVRFLANFRDNDVVIRVPQETGGELTLRPELLYYDSLADFIVVQTELDYNVPERP